MNTGIVEAARYISEWLAILQKRVVVIINAKVESINLENGAVYYSISCSFCKQRDVLFGGGGGGGGEFLKTDS